MKIRPRREVVDRCRELADELRTALSRLPQHADDLGVVKAVWQGEGLGALLWSLGLAELPPYDRPFDHEQLLAIPLDGAELRESDDVASARETARLWHWRARMTLQADEPGFELPAPWTSVQELVSSVASRGHEQGLLPAPIGDDFPALGLVYRWATPPEFAELQAIAYERHRAFNWVCDSRAAWDDVGLDT